MKTGEVRRKSNAGNLATLVTVAMQEVASTNMKWENSSNLKFPLNLAPTDIANGSEVTPPLSDVQAAFDASGGYLGIAFISKKRRTDLRAIKKSQKECKRRKLCMPKEHLENTQQQKKMRLQYPTIHKNLKLNKDQNTNFQEDNESLAAASARDFEMLVLHNRLFEANLLIEHFNLDIKFYREKCEQMSIVLKMLGCDFDKFMEEQAGFGNVCTQKLEKRRVFHAGKNKSGKCSSITDFKKHMKTTWNPLENPNPQTPAPAPPMRYIN